MERIRARGGTPGVNRHRTHVPLVAANLLHVPGRQVRIPFEEGPPPVQSDGCNTARGEGRRRLVCESLQAGAARHLGLLRLARTQEQIALRVEVQGALVAAQKRARRQRRRRIQVLESAESSKSLRGGGGRVADSRVFVEENVTRLRIHNNAPRGVIAFVRANGDRPPQLLELRFTHRIARGLGGHRRAGRLKRGGSRCRLGGGDRGGCAASAQKGDCRHKRCASAYNWPHRRAMHEYPFVVT